jgi:hypothetical protein
MFLSDDPEGRRAFRLWLVLLAASGTFLWFSAVVPSARLAKRANCQETVTRQDCFGAYLHAQAMAAGLRP